MKNEERTNISKNTIIDAATVEFSNKGYEGTSLNQFCANHCISKGKLYHHFNGKDDLFVACVEKGYLDLTDIVKTFQVNRNASYEENLHNYFQLRQDYFLQYPYRALVMYRVLQNTPTSIKDTLIEIREKFRVVNSEGLFEILKDVPLQRGVSINIIISAFDIASNYVHILHGAPRWKPEEDMKQMLDGSLKIFDDVMQILLYGVLPREEI